MSKIAKLLLTVVIIFLFFILFAVALHATQSAGGGIIGLILMAVTVGALRGLWKKPTEDNENEDNHPSVLQK